MSNTIIKECAMSCSNCHDYYTNKKEYLITLKTTINQVFNKMFYQFENKGINKDKLIDNIVKCSLTKDVCSELHPIAGAFSVLYNSFIYYKKTKNELMINFVDLALMEANLMYFEGEFSNEYELNTRDKNFLEYVIDKSF